MIGPNNRFPKKLKTALFNFYWFIPIIGIVVSTILYYNSTAHLTIIKAILGSTLGLCYFIQKQKLEEAKFFNGIFKDFNARYAKFNHAYSSSLEIEDMKLKRKLLTDYFNLCSEEYLLYIQGYIPLEVWDSWAKGIDEYWKDPFINEEWRKELEKGSYYGFNPTELFSE